MRGAQNEKGRRRPWWWPGKYVSDAYPIDSPGPDPLDYDGRRCQHVTSNLPGLPCVRRWDHVDKEREATGIALHRAFRTDGEGGKVWFEWREN